MNFSSRKFESHSDSLVLRYLYVRNEFRIEIGEAGKFSLVNVHYNDFVGWSQIWSTGGELPVEVADILRMGLK